MASRKLMEVTVALLQAQIKANIAAALTEVRNDRGDSAVSTEPPPTQSYFIYKGAQSYRCPAIFLIGEDTDFRKQAKGANMITSMDRVYVSCVVEDKYSDKLVIKAWRYQAALHKILDETSLTSSDGKVKIISIVIRSAVSPEFAATQGKDTTEGVFRREIVFECECEHYENY